MSEENGKEKKRGISNGGFFKTLGDSFLIRVKSYWKYNDLWKEKPGTKINADIKMNGPADSQ
jgi:hypothetical protein